ncbi:MAG: hypothetical protein NVS1B14_03710 [Vulcanimicrobiaceae bacterium]
MLTPTPKQQSQIDHYGELERRVTEFQPIATERLALRAEILGWALHAAPEAALSLAGHAYTLQIGPCAQQQRITSMRRLFRAIGQGLFLDNCTFPLKVLDALKLSDTAPFLTNERTGNRNLTAVPIAPASRAT